MQPRTNVSAYKRSRRVRGPRDDAATRRNPRRRAVAREFSETSGPRTAAAMALDETQARLDETQVRLCTGVVVSELAGELLWRFARTCLFHLTFPLHSPPAAAAVAGVGQGWQCGGRVAGAASAGRAMRYREGRFRWSPRAVFPFSLSPPLPPHNSLADPILCGSRTCRGCCQSCSRRSQGRR